MDDTIAAIATASGAAGLAVVRLSGPRAIDIADRVFCGSAPLSEARGGTLHHGWAMWPERATEEDKSAFPAAKSPSTVADRDQQPSLRPLDEVVAAVFRAPRSYTREHVIEFSCHGGSLSAERVLTGLLHAGARLAKPGEFTLRAFLNGRLDLAQAEAVADVIHAESEAAHGLALSQLAGALSRAMGDIVERLKDVLAEVEARIDFAEDVGGIEVPPHVIDSIDGASAELTALLEGAAYARAIREGVRLPLVGRPNVGKSSLFNALVGEARAIVTATPGTTRDRISEAIEVAGVRVTLSDTAGLRDRAEEIESMGISLARQALEESSVVLWVVDGASTLEEEDRWIASRLASKQVLVALNKRDLGETVVASEVERALNGVTALRVVAVSALRGDGVQAIRLALADLLRGRSSAGQRIGSEGLATAVGNRRHVEALTQAAEALTRAKAVGGQGAPGEIVALELREALAKMGEVTGETVSEDLLERIFSRFCIGK